MDIPTSSYTTITIAPKIRMRNSYYDLKNKNILSYLRNKILWTMINKIISECPNQQWNGLCREEATVIIKLTSGFEKQKKY